MKIWIIIIGIQWSWNHKSIATDILEIPPTVIFLSYLFSNADKENYLEDNHVDDKDKLKTIYINQ